MPKFDFGSGVLNNIKLPVISRSIDLNRTDINQTIRIAAEKSYTPDAIKSTGPYKAVVLRVEKSNDGKVEPEGFLDFVYSLFKGDDKPANSGIKQMTQIKARIPELHAHLPLPTGDQDVKAAGYPDHYIIDMYPTFTSESDREEFTKVQPGDIVVVDFGDKKNMTDPIFVTPLAVQQHIPSPASGQGSFPAGCAPPTGMMPGNAMAGTTSAGAHAGVSSDALRARSTNATAILFGDSQMQGALGKALSEYAKSLGYTAKGTSGIGSEGRMYRSGSPVSAWVKSGKSKDPSGDGKWGFVDSALKSHKPELIIICLGGNGVGAGNPTKLIKKIRGVSANSKILWIGPPPASVATNEKRAKASFPKAFRENGKNWAVATRAPGRIKKANLIESEIGNMPNVSYVNTPKVLPNYPNNPGPGTDGIHMSANGAIQLLNKIKTTASPAAAGSATPDKAQQKPKHSNKAAPPGSGASDPNNPMSKVWQDSNKELLLKIFEKENQKWNNLQAATNYIKDKSKAWGEEEGKTEVYDSYNNRDWISGYLMEDGHVKAMSVDVSVWQPVRTEELIAWMNFTTKPSTKIPKDPYGPEVFLASYVPANQNQSTDTTLNPMGDWPETQAIIKAESYSMAAAAYMVATGGEQQPNPATAAPVAAGQDPPCPQPMGNAGGGGTFDPSGPIQLPPDGIHTFIPLIEDAINNAVSLVAPLNIGIPADQLKLYLRASCMVESGGKINAINKFGYSGLWQWGGTAWKEGSRKGTGRLYKQATGKSPPPFIRDYNYALSPYIQALMTACAVASKVKTLKKVGAPVIAQHIYMIHNQGAGGFSNIWRRMKTSNQWGGTLAKGGDGDFRRAWANGCGHHGLKKRHAAGQAPTPWLDCRPGTFYKTWTGIWNSKVKKVSKPGKQGGASPNKGYVSRMAHNTNVGQSGFKASLPEADRQRKGQRDARADSPGGPQNGGPSLAGANIPAGGQWRKS